MKSKIKDLPISNPPEEEVIPLEEKPKRQVSEQQLMNLAKARERAKERKKELAEFFLNVFNQYLSRHAIINQVVCLYFLVFALLKYVFLFFCDEIKKLIAFFYHIRI